MNTVARQVFWLAVVFAIAYPILKRVQKPRPPDPFNEPVPTPAGGIHCLLLGEEAVQSYMKSWTAAADPGANPASPVSREKVLGEIDDAERECSVAASERERQGILEMRRALGLVRDGLRRPAGESGSPRGAASPGNDEISEHVARARELLR
jgi:hypothetical protein